MRKAREIPTRRAAVGVRPQSLVFQKKSRPFQNISSPVAGCGLLSSFHQNTTLSADHHSSKSAYPFTFFCRDIRVQPLSRPRVVRLSQGPGQFSRCWQFSATLGGASPRLAPRKWQIEARAGPEGAVKVFFLLKDALLLWHDTVFLSLHLVHLWNVLVLTQAGLLHLQTSQLQQASSIKLKLASRSGRESNTFS